MRMMIALLAGLLTMAGPTLASERLALVIGNGSYGNLGRLPNPVGDAELIAANLREAGFGVTLLTDVTQDAMKRAIVAFGRDLRRAGDGSTALFYFAGHGIQSKGVNYLLPVGTGIRDEADLGIEAVDAYWVLDQMESAGNTTNIVILDACRNNPFAQSFRSVGRGLARMDAPPGSFISYATAPGAVAFDGNGRHSPFTAALARHILSPGLQIEQLFKRVRVDVLDETERRQTPWDSSSLTADFAFVDAAQPAPVVPRPSLPDQTAVAKATPAPKRAEPSVAYGDGLRVEIETSYRNTGWRCKNPGTLGVLDLVLDGKPLKVASSDGDDFLDYTVSAVRDGDGVALTILPLVGGTVVRPIEAKLDDLKTGTLATAYSTTRLPNRIECGSVIAYVRVVK